MPSGHPTPRVSALGRHDHPGSLFVGSQLDRLPDQAVLAPPEHFEPLERVDHHQEVIDICGLAERP